MALSIITKKKIFHVIPTGYNCISKRMLKGLMNSIVNRLTSASFVSESILFILLARYTKIMFMCQQQRVTVKGTLQ